MASKVIALRIQQHLHDRLVDRALEAGYPSLSAFIIAHLQPLAEGLPTTIEAAPSQTATVATPPVEDFFRVVTLSGHPKFCPRCSTPHVSPVWSYERASGGTWSCPSCLAYGKWFSDRPPTVEHTGLRLGQWQKDRDAFEHRERD